jgi:alpha-galactosidase
MIEVFDKTFKLDTEHTSYIFTVTGHGHLEHIYYGQKIPDQDCLHLAF